MKGQDFQAMVQVRHVAPLGGLGGPAGAFKAQDFQRFVQVHPRAPKGANGSMTFLFRSAVPDVQTPLHRST
jgi:hypothetical protein